MQFSELFTRRRQEQQSRIFKYFKYIFNDHFVFVLFFLLGAFIFQYLNWLKTGDTSSSYWGGIWALVMTSLLGIGRPATYIREADLVFLIPKESEFSQYFTQSYRYSLLLPSLILLFAAGLSYPFLLVVKNWTIMELLALVAVLLLLKANQLLNQYRNFHWSGEKRQLLRWAWLYGSSFIVLLVTYYVSVWLALATAAIMFLTIICQARRRAAPDYNWPYILEKESQRQRSIEQVLSLFVDIPRKREGIKRRAYFDFLLFPAYRSHSVFSFLYSRLFWRSQQYFNLWLRLTVVGVLLVAFLPQNWLSLVISVLILYTAHFQLLPMFKRYNHDALLKTMPLDAENESLRAFQRFLWQPLLLQVFILGLAYLLIDSWTYALSFLAMGLIFALLFNGLYVPQQLKGSQAKKRISGKKHSKA